MTENLKWLKESGGSRISQKFLTWPNGRLTCIFGYYLKNRMKIKKQIWLKDAAAPTSSP